MFRSLALALAAMLGLAGTASADIIFGTGPIAGAPTTTGPNNFNLIAGVDGNGATYINGITNNNGGGALATNAPAVGGVSVGSQTFVGSNFLGNYSPVTGLSRMPPSPATSLWSFSPAHRIRTTAG